MKKNIQLQLNIITLKIKEYNKNNFNLIDIMIVNKINNKKMLCQELYRILINVNEIELKIKTKIIIFEEK